MQRRFQYHRIATTNSNKHKVASNNKQLLKSASKNKNTKITLKDLCQEEKWKIGRLMKKLAQRDREKEKLINEFNKERRELCDSIIYLKDHEKVLF